MRPIWFFVGGLLLVLGLIILGAGFADLIWPGESQKVLAHLHPRVWWGAIMSVGGLLFLLFNRRVVE